MDTSIRIIKADAEHVESFFPLFTKSISTQFPEYSPNTTRYFLEQEYPAHNLKKSIQEGRTHVFLAMIHNEVVGFLFGLRIYGGIGLCEWLAVDEAHQSHGIGSTLITTWENYVQEHGGHKVDLWSVEKNIAYYQKRGYILVGKIPANYFGADDYLLYKELFPAIETNFLKEFLEA